MIVEEKKNKYLNDVVRKEDDLKMIIKATSLGTDSSTRNHSYIPRIRSGIDNDQSKEQNNSIKNKTIVKLKPIT